MALGAQSALESRSSGSSNNGGGFCYSGPTYPTDLAATSATTSAPVVTSASYNFVAGDVGMWLYIKSGTNWTPGLYQIASVASNAATLGKACATTSSPTAGTWSVDYTQQNSSQFSGTDLDVNAVTNTIVTSPTHTFTQADVGNWLHITAGTGWTTGWYQINSVSGGAATLDRSPAATGVLNGTWAEGGAVTFTDLPNAMVASNQAWHKGSFTLTTRPAFAQTCTPSPTVPHSKIEGYGTARGDGVQVSCTLSTNSALALCNLTGSGWIVSGFNISCASLTTSRGVLSAGAYVIVRNCKVSNAAVQGILNNGSVDFYVHHCEVTGSAGGTGVSAAISGGNNSVVYDCWVHDNTATGIYGWNCSIHRCVISNNSGSTSDGIDITNSSAGAEDVEANTIYKSGRHGINCHLKPARCRNNIITDHTAAGAGGLRCDTAALPASPEYDGNFYYNNATHRINVDDCGGTANSNSTTTNPVFFSGLYTNALDQFLTGTPFNGAGSNDFTLNNTASAGALVRANGLPGVGGTLYSGIPGLGSSTGYLDGGVFQHQAVGGGGPPGIIMSPVYQFMDT